MTDRARPRAPSLSIAAVERDTGLPKDTLRVWERRYGFPRPDRDPAGDRLYPPEQVERLHTIRRLLDAGHRPGQVVALEAKAMQELLAEPASGDPAGTGPVPDGAAGVETCMALIARHDVLRLRQELRQAALRLGLDRFVVELVAPLNAAVGDAWMKGRMLVSQEHLYTECVTGVLRNSITGIPLARGAGAPRILLTTLPQEPHGLGLLMAEALLALEGCTCLSLGPQTPVGDIVLSAQAYQADVVALSFTALLRANTVLAGLRQLRKQLPDRVALWAGGECPALYTRPIPGVLAARSLPSLYGHVAGWRQAASTRRK
jgi:DNA-binding transcriptional MerR regulator/methylmalonyl-CoA mutase cobalamin-binding subunit